jgi:hypothetical protein
MQAPLGRAVIGGLVMSTFATLLVVPSIFALVIGRRVARSPSVYPDDPDSAHYDPLLWFHKDKSGKEVPAAPGQSVSDEAPPDGDSRAAQGGRPPPSEPAPVPEPAPSPGVP